MYTFEQLLSELPDCDEFTTVESMPVGLNYVSSDTTTFVPPNLAAVEQASEDYPLQVLIVSAPGAVGKSTLAHQIAFRKHALLWDLAIAPEVGSGSLDGMLLHAIAPSQMLDYREFLQEGLQFLIVDALDEGRLKVNEQSFQRLLEDIAGIASSSKGLCFVLLGRTQIAETSWVVLTDLGTNAEMISIETFNRDLANVYLENHIPSEKLTPPLYACRDLIFQRLAFSVTDGSNGDSATEFLHYPPVLDVVATLLKEESNLQELHNTLSVTSYDAPNGSIHLLKSVVERILQREQQKVLPAVRGALAEVAEQCDWSDWDSLYANAEQCKRLLGSLLSEQVASSPAGLPDELRDVYEVSSEVATALLEHPFLQGTSRLTNRVFEAYLNANALLGLYGEGLKTAVTRKLLDPHHLPTRLLAAFYLIQSEDSPGHRRNIAPEHLGIIYDSFRSSESTRSVVRLCIDGSDPFGLSEDAADEADVEFEFLNVNREGTVEESMADPFAFTMPIATETTISFSNQLREAQISVPCTVELGLPGREFNLGPSVHLEVGSLVMKAQSLIVNGQAKRSIEQDTSVMLEALFCDSTGLSVPPTVYGPDNFHVSWPGAQQYPWNRYAHERHIPDFSEDRDLATAYIRFRRIATTFRSHGRGSLARTRVKVEHQRVLQGSVGHALLQKLIEDSVLSFGDGGSRYFWNANVADNLLGVTWQDLRNGNTPDSLRQYLLSFVREHRALF